MTADHRAGRTLGLLGATGVGIGAIVGGGILALAGVAFAATGPAAIVAFAVNGIIAALTALSYAEMSSAFPESGGSYTFAKKVLTVEAAFTVGWVVWFASIVAGVLYALGFAAYGVILVEALWESVAGPAPHWLSDRGTTTIAAAAATVLYTLGLIRKSTGGGQWATVGKVVLFAVLIIGGLWVVAGRPRESLGAALSPFFAGGTSGLFLAMGYTFIALQGFDLIAAVGGEVRDPSRTIPRAMLLSLGAALVIYIPFLFVIATVGVPAGESITAFSARHPETIAAVAVQNFLGPPGFWVVLAAAVLSMLSALHANLFAASRVALAMARDRTLPGPLAAVRRRQSIPVPAVLTTALAVCVLLLVISDVAAAGAVASLIFLISFALVHWTSILVRMRAGGRGAAFRVPYFPFVQAVGGTACIALAVFQAVVVPAAGTIAVVWLAVGGVLYLVLFARRARVVDASAEAADPHLVRLRGRSPLVLVPIANPASAEAMVTVANALAPPGVGRVLLLSVVAASQGGNPEERSRRLRDAQNVLGQFLTASFGAGFAPEALTTVAPHPWPEISRVSKAYRCESLLLGFSDLAEDVEERHLERLMGSVDCDVVVLRAVPGWRLPDARRVLVPLGGSGSHDALRARLLGSLCRLGGREITFMRVMPERAGDEDCERARRGLARVVRDEVPGDAKIEIVRSNSAADEITSRAADCGLVILGLQRVSRRQKLFGTVPLQVARDTTCGIIMISRRR